MSPNPTPQPNSFLIQTVRPRSLSMEQKSKALSKRKKRIPGRGTNVFFPFAHSGTQTRGPNGAFGISCSQIEFSRINCQAVN